MSGCKAYLERKGLKLNEAKTRVLDARRESFHFLGFQIRWRRSCRRPGTHYPHVEPSQKARKKLRDSVRKTPQPLDQGRSCAASVTQLTRPCEAGRNTSTMETAPGPLPTCSTGCDQRLRRWLWRKYGRTHGLYTFFTDDRLHGQYQLFQLPTHAPYLR